MTMTMTMTTESDAASAPQGSRVSARWRIVAWIMLTTLIGLTALVVTVDSALRTDVDREANADVSQEVEEFRTFLVRGSDPETAKPFVSTQRLFEVYLARQQPSDAELLVGASADRPDQVLSTAGRSTPALQDYDPLADRQLMDATRRAPSGVTDTSAGQVRWARVAVDSTGDKGGTLYVFVFTQHREDEVAGTTRLITAVAVASLLLTVFISYIVAGQILRPIRQMRAAAEEIGEDDLARRIPVSGRDDIAELAVTVNTMLDRVERAFAAQRRFVDDASHELRTLVSIIRGQLEVLPEDPQGRREAIAIATDELDRMSRTVTDLLSLAQAERPDYVRRRDDVDLAILTLDLDAKVASLGDRRWTLTEVADGYGRVDPQRISQAVLQLAQNAVQHTAPGDRIRLGSRFVDLDGQRWVEFTVSDEGPGVLPEDAERIFERFTRSGDGRGPDAALQEARLSDPQTADASLEDTQPLAVPGAQEPAASPGPARSGAGLGLAIVRAIADGHEGVVFVDSMPGMGATFGLRVPVGPGDERTWDDDIHDPDGTDDADLTDPTDTGGAHPTASRARVQA